MNPLLAFFFLIFLGLGIYGGLVAAKIVPNPFGTPAPPTAAITMGITFPAPTTKKA